MEPRKMAGEGVTLQANKPLARLQATVHGNSIGIFSLCIPYFFCYLSRPP